MQVVKYILQCIYIIVDNPDYNSTFVHPNRNWNWLIPAINYLHIPTMALVFEVISNSSQLWYSGPIQFLSLNIYIQTEPKCNCTNQCMLWLVIKNDLGIIPLIFYLTMQCHRKEYSEWFIIIIDQYLSYIYIILWLTLVIERSLCSFGIWLTT